MMDHRALSPAETNEEDMDDGSPPSSPAEDFEQRVKPKKIRANKSLIVKEGKKKKRKVSDIPDSVWLLRLDFGFIYLWWIFN